MNPRVYLLTDRRMALHHPLRPVDDDDDDENSVCFENPNRTHRMYEQLLKLEDRLTIHQRHDSYGIDTACDMKKFRHFIELPCVPAARETIELVHSSHHYDWMHRTSFMTDAELRELTVPSDLYFNKFTFLAARLAVGGVVESVNAVTSKNAKTTRAIALVRPPGHHACVDEAMGFCYFNNIAVAAKHALFTNRAKRVFILDWDIHHGNGIQDITYDDPNIFYLSIHRASFGSNTNKDWFYPGTGRHTEVGTGAGTGSNLNIVWQNGGMGNVEYAAAFSEVVLPLVCTFQPDLIIIGCGFDAAKGDLLGDCGLSTDMYYTMTKSLLKAAGRGIPFVVALEGGYKLDVCAACMEAVALALLNKPLNAVQPKRYDSLDFSSSEEEDDLVDGDQLVWSSWSILPQKRKYFHGNNAQRNFNDFGLAQYWTHDQVTGAVKKVTRLAVASVKRSIKALANVGTFLGDFHEFVAPARDWKYDIHRPLKKRMIRGAPSNRLPIRAYS